MKITESTNIELKRQFTDKIKKEVVAFANTSGGIIYVGINDDGSVQGVENEDKEMLRISSSIRQSIKPDILPFVSFASEIIEDKTVIKLTVQRGTARPYYIARKGLTPAGVYVRLGTESVQASDEAIFKMRQEASGERFEQVRSFNQRLTFVEFSRYSAARNIVFEKKEKRRLNLITQEGQYTNLSLLLSDQCVHTIKADVFESTEPLASKDRKEFTGSILRQLNDVYQWLDFHNCTSAQFDGLYRKEIRDYPPVAIREALLNAIVHRNYGLDMSIFIHLFADRIEIVSAGGLVEGLSRDDILLGISATRNANLCKVFYRFQLVEAYGSGLRRIYAVYKSTIKELGLKEEAHLSPSIVVTDNAFKITLPNLRYKP